MVFSGERRKLLMQRALEGGKYHVDHARRARDAGCDRGGTAVDQRRCAGRKCSGGGPDDGCGSGRQAASVGQAVSGAANAQALTDIPKALFGLSGIFTNEPPWLTDLGKALGLTGHTWSSDGSGLIVGGVLGDFVQGVTGSAELDASVAMDTFGKWVSPARLMVTQFKDYFGLAHDLPKWASEGAKAAGEAAKALPAAVPAIPSAGLSGVAGAVGQAASVGGLKVPAVWTATTPAASPAVLAASNGLGAAAAAEGSTHAFGGMPLMGSGAGRAFNNFAAPRYGFKPTVIAQPPAGG